MHAAADAVAAEVGGHAATGLARDGVDGVGDVADATARLGGGNAGVEGLLGGVDQIEVAGAGRSDGEGDSRVARPAVELSAAVDAHQVAVAQPVAAGDAV